MAIPYTMEFEKPLVEIEGEIHALEGRSPEESEAYADEIAGLRKHHDKLLAKIYTSLSPVDTVRVARHPQRPQTSDYIRLIAKDFVELHGDRRYGEDPAIITGFGRIGSHKCLIVGHNKGKDTNEKIACHFGCAHPEGYRKALQKMKLAEKFGVPIVTLVDTPGAFPGVGAEQRGQAEAIAVNMREMARIRVPIVSCVIGEGGSGGALGIAVADRVSMLKHAWYAVISPEGCAAILWKKATPETNAAAASALHITANDNIRLGIVDDIIDEPAGGAHRNPEATGDLLKAWVVEHLGKLKRRKPETLLNKRYQRFRALGAFAVAEPPPPPAADADTPDKDRPES